MTKKEKYRIIIRTGSWFLLLFFLCACLITIYDAMRNRKLGQEAFNQKKIYVYERLVNGTEEQLQKIINDVDNSAKSSLNGNFQNQYYSYQIFNDNGELLAESKNCLNIKIGEGETAAYEIIFPDQLLTPEQMESFILAMEENSRNKAKPPKYRFLYRTDGKGGQETLSGLYIEKLEWVSGEEEESARPDPWLSTLRSWKSESDGKNYLQSGSEMVMEWNQSAAKAEDGEYKEIQVMAFPYYQDGFRHWNYWEQEEWLHGDSEKEIFGKNGIVPEINWENGRTISKGYIKTKMESWIKFSLTNNKKNIYLHIRTSGRNMYTSLENLKWAYLVMLFILGVCASFLAHGQIRTEEKRQQMEQERKDFINGMTHELKTPLAIIRMCGDNLRIKELELKRDYYLDMINLKTEEMDTMIRQMITLSQINSIHFMLKPQGTDLKQLVAACLARIAPLLSEKQIDLQLEMEPVVKEVNQKYFEQLVSNLLSNAVSYVAPGGYIRIILNDKELSVENAGEPVNDEWRRDMFDLFSSGKQIHNGREKHLGYGLYLVKKVADLHGMGCEAENTASGNLFRIGFKGEE